MLASHRQLPPLQSLVYFESAARHLNFTAAAEELGTSQPAVSQRVRGVEDHFGVRLFQRLHRGVRLTSEGQRLFQAVSDSLDNLRSASASVRADAPRRTLTLATDVGFAKLWLMPRMATLRADMPDVNLRLITSQQDTDGPGDDVDLRIVFDHSAPADATPLFPERVVPVCSPRVLERLAAGHGPADLAGLPLLQLLPPEAGPPRWMDWQEWFRARGVPQAGTESALTFNDYTLVLQAAAAGLGVALGWAPLVNDLLARGELVAAHDTPLQTPRGYFLLAPRRTAPGGPLARFREWLVQACAGTPS